MSIHFSSKTDVYSTPQDFFNNLNKEFCFDLDPCATAANAKCKNFYTVDDNGLEKDWGKSTVFVKPPYGREITKWLSKAFNSSLLGAAVVCLVPARTDTKWWHLYVMKGEIRFIKGRLRFGEAKHNAPFPSAVVVFRPGAYKLTNANVAT